MAMFDAVKGAVQLMTGVTEVTLAKARDAATALVNQGLAGESSTVVDGVQELAEELWTTGQDNRQMLLETVRVEVDRAVNRMGFVREDELASVRRHVDRLEAELARAQEELSLARQDAATSSIVVAAETADDADIAESVVDSARRIAAVTGALGAVPGLAGGPWARVARDLATSAAGIVAAAATQQRTSTASATGRSAMTSPPAGPSASTPAPKTSAQKASAQKKSAPKKSAPKKSAPKTSAPKTSVPKKSVPKTSVPKKSVPKKSVPKKSVPKKSVPKTSPATQPLPTGEGA